MSRNKAVPPDIRDMALALHSAGLRPKLIAELLRDHFDIRIDDDTIQVWRVRAKARPVPPQLHARLNALAEYAVATLKKLERRSDRTLWLTQAVSILAFEKEHPHLRQEDVKFLIGDLFDRMNDGELIPPSGFLRVIELADALEMKADELEAQGKEIPIFSQDQRGGLTAFATAWAQGKEMHIYREGRKPLPKDFQMEEFLTFMAKEIGLEAIKQALRNVEAKQKGGNK